MDLKRRIQGDFYVIEQDDEKIVLGNRACPFAEKVVGRPALCMMTSNVFGSIAAENLGYAKVVIEQAIAQRRPRLPGRRPPEADARGGGRPGPGILQGVAAAVTPETFLQLADLLPEPTLLVSGGRHRPRRQPGGRGAARAVPDALRGRPLAEVVTEPPGEVAQLPAGLLPQPADGARLADGRGRRAAACRAEGAVAPARRRTARRPWSCSAWSRSSPPSGSSSP